MIENTEENRSAVYKFILSELYTEGDIGIYTGPGGVRGMDVQRLGVWWAGRIIEDISLAELVSMVQYAFGGIIPYNHERDLLDLTLGDLATAALTH